jgi:Flp pilus assembly pilin Flp
VILPAALPCLLALRLGVSRSTRVVGLWLALDVACAALKRDARETGAIDLERAAWCLPGVVLACLAVDATSRRPALALPVVIGAGAWAAATFRGSAWWLVFGLGLQALVGTAFVLRRVAKARRLGIEHAVLLGLLVLDLASAVTALLVGIGASWSALADLRLTAHGLLCLTLALSPPRD